MEKPITIVFPECGKLVPPVIAFADVAFSYSGISLFGIRPIFSRKLTDLYREHSMST